MKTFNVIGKPVSQSKSPKIFNFIFKYLKINAIYKSKEISNINDLKIFIDNCKDAGINGLNITMPYKQKLLSIIDNKDEIVQLTKSINCIKINKNNITGYNNDYYGFKQLLSINNVHINKTNNIVLGSGGSARTVILYLIQNNAKNIKILSRNKQTSLEIIKDFKSLSCKTTISLFCNQTIYQDYNLINCTPIGLKKETEKNILSQIERIHFNVIIDINYIYDSDFLDLSYKKIITGEDMFIFQAFKSLDIWFESKISDKLDYKKIKELIC